MKLFRMLGVLFAVVFVSLSAGMPVATAASGGQNISWSYVSEETLKTGTIVSLVEDTGNKVEPTNISNASRILGVVVNSDNSLVEIDPDRNKIQVATSGRVNALVSTVNGAIKKGDKLTASPLNGVAMKYINGGYTIDSALSDFNVAGDGVEKQQITDKEGKTTSVAIGYAAINLLPQYDASKDGDQNLNGLQTFVRSLTGHVVSMPRIIASIALAVLTLAAIITLLYAAIYGSIVSIGRNPLARDDILKALLQALLLAILAAAFAVSLMYLLLR